MRTLAAGSRALKRTPLAVLPMGVESLVLGALVAAGAMPRGAESAAAGAVFPLSLYFDLKQALAFSISWPSFVAALLLSLLVRGAVIGFTLWLADGRRGPAAGPWARAVRLGGIALFAFLPAAVLMYLGVALRYAPFIWLGAIAGLLAVVGMIRRALALDAGAGVPRGEGVPETPALLAYAYLLSTAGAAVSLLARVSPLLAGLLIACLGPLHVLILLGWREHRRAETYPGGGTISFAVTAVGLLLLAGAVTYDRVIRDPSPRSVANATGSLLLLGGVDSTSDTGALTDLDPRDIGFPREATRVVSYREGTERYSASDTRRDFSEAADAVASQVEASDRPVLLLGHSQAALILDRMIMRGLPAPDRSVVLAGPPPVPPPFDVPPPGQDGEGRVAGDIARSTAALLQAVGLPGFDIDAPASPTQLDPVLVIDKEVSRVSVWALADSVWLDSDWRRPGEVNMVAMSDHVGVTNNSRALDAARVFLSGSKVEDDEVSWRAVLATVLRYAFEPWRPG
ncbi:MAG: hypothetical protein ACLGIB_00595 [Actinomycetota bacterium]